MDVIFRLEQGERGILVQVVCAECETVAETVPTDYRTYPYNWKCQTCEDRDEAELQVERKGKRHFKATKRAGVPFCGADMVWDTKWSTDIARVNCRECLKKVAKIKEGDCAA